MHRLLLASIAFLFIMMVTFSAQAERVVALSADGHMRILANPGCSGSGCDWIDIDRNRRTIGVAATSDKLFQLHNSGAIWRWKDLPCSDQSCSHWARIDNNRRTIAIVGNDNNLFQLHRSGDIWRWLGEDCEEGCRSWKKIGNTSNVKSIIANGSLLFRLDNNGEIWRWKGQPCVTNRCASWDKLDRNARTEAITVGKRGTLYQKHSNGHIWKWNGQPCVNNSCPSWTKIDRNGATEDIFAASGNLFQRHSNGNVWQWQGKACEGNRCPFWTRIGQNADWRQIEAAADKVYALTKDGNVQRWTGRRCQANCSPWTDLGSALNSITETRGRLYVFDGSPTGMRDRLVSIPPRPGDKDGDGLPDAWEIERADWGLSPNIADLIIVKVLRPEVAENPTLNALADTNLESTKAFFASIPVITEQGSQGINVVIRNGKPLSNFYRESVTNAFGYGAVRRAGMPPDLIGYGHGLLIGTGTNGGGQTSGNLNWSGVSNNYPTFVHEIGHQLDLSHNPFRQPQSPLYTSLMNYDYSYQFDGDAQKIHFSKGKFAGIELNEKDLDEAMPYSASDLSFLTKRPYRYDVKVINAATSSVDWNRNGIHFERSIRADINDGSGLNVDLKKHVNGATGDVALVAKGDVLFALTTQMPRADLKTYDGQGASPSKPAHLEVTSIRNNTVIRTTKLTRAPIMTGAPSAINKNGKILIAFPSAFNTVNIGAYEVSVSSQLSGDPISFNPRAHKQVTLVDTGQNNAVDMLLWDPQTKDIETRRVTLSPSLRVGEPQQVRIGSGALKSQAPPAATFNETTGELIILITEDERVGTNTISDRLKLAITAESGAGHWSVRNSRWLSSASAKTTMRPAIVFDKQDGRYLVYYAGPIEATRMPGTRRLEFVRVTLPDTPIRPSSSPYTNRKMDYINIWTVSRNGPAVTPFMDDFAVLWRTHEGYAEHEIQKRNRAELNTYASGEFSKGKADQDDITHIATRGLWSRLLRERPSEP